MAAFDTILGHRICLEISTSSSDTFIHVLSYHNINGHSLNRKDCRFISFPASFDSFLASSVFRLPEVSAVNQTSDEGGRDQLKNHDECFLSVGTTLVILYNQEWTPLVWFTLRYSLKLQISKGQHDVVYECLTRVKKGPFSF